ncbi:damage-control phosphatase, subfamily III, partial [Lecanoromycetidae sp. Uapishka_2]
MAPEQMRPAPPYMISDKTSFAYISAKDRWPVIVTGIIDDVHRAIVDNDDEANRNEGKTILEGLAKLKYELQHDRQMVPLEDDGKGDIAQFNEQLETLGNPRWFSAPWLYAECYLYRRVHTFFALSSLWKTYDAFARQKLSTFQSSRPAVIELAAKYRALVEQLEGDHTTADNAKEREDADQILFMEMCEICLWGNATDLSLLTSLTYEDIQKLQGAEARKKAEKKILANDLPAAFKVLAKAREDNPKAERRVDIVLDNAGFELYVDLILAGYLLVAGLATQVILHPKSIPWFVSDVLPNDFAALLSALSDPERFYSAPNDENSRAKPQSLSENQIVDLVFLFRHWAECQAEGQLIIRPNLFWTSAKSFWDLPKEAGLYEDLKGSELVIFKGDLNYRKLTAD